MAKREHPRYENTDWPDYEFREFPMMVYPGSSDGGRTPDRDPKKPGAFLQDAIVVNNEAERRAALELEPEEAEEAPAARKAEFVETSSRGVRRLKTADDDRAEALEEADALGVQVDKSWSLARIQDAIDTHRAEAAAPKEVV